MRQVFNALVLMENMMKSHLTSLLTFVIGTILVVACSGFSESSAEEMIDAPAPSLDLLTRVDGGDLCELKRDELAVTYTTSVTTKDGLVGTKSQELWRNGRQTVHRALDTQVSDAYYLQSNNLVKLTRYFDGHQRGIEYSASELPQDKALDGWQALQQTVDIGTLTDEKYLAGSSGQGCKGMKQFVKSTDTSSMKLLWNEELALVLSLQVEKKGILREWVLASVVDKKTQQETTQAWESFQLTDYADVGDNESDPFLLKMVNLGFIEHGASGFYDADGNQLGGNHHHH
ncbi:MAG: hypothetical protein VX210_17485 [Myxococcota bacterium]|nr:hypothetical protein [Myxococcota bacterium]